MISVSTARPIYHELNRNGDGIGRYDVDVAHRHACDRRSRASRMPRTIPPEFIGAFVYLWLENDQDPNVFANTIAPAAPSISTRWLYELIDRTHRNGDSELT